VKTRIMCHQGGAGGESGVRVVTNDEITQPDIPLRRSLRATRDEYKPLTRAQAFYAVLWLGFDAREIRRYL
jgi:hypothetical protein